MTSSSQPRQLIDPFDDASRILVEDRDLIADMLAHAPVGIVLVWGPERRYRFANRRALEMLPTGDVIGRTVGEVFLGTAAPAEEVFRSVIDDGETVDLDRTAVPGPGGRRLWIEGTISPIRDGSAAIRGALGVFVDASAHERERLGLTRALAREHGLTVALQRGLLADAEPCVPGADVAVRYLPATAGMTVGGDFYDVHRAEDGRTLLTIGDVCGKGADAAALTAVLRHTIRAVAPYEAGPGAILRATNRAMCRSGNDGRFSTVALAVLERGSAATRATVALGGHMPPLVRRADGRVEPVGEPGTLLGVYPDPDLPEASVELRRGDLLVLYTDGLTEAHAPRVLSTRDVAAALAATGSAAPGPTLDSLVSDLAGGPTGLRDDLAMVAFRRSR